MHFSWLKALLIGVLLAKDLVFFRTPKLYIYIYIAMATVASKAIWLQHLLHDLYQIEILNSTTLIWCGNQSIFVLVNTTKFHSHTKYIAVCYYFTCQLATHKKIEFNYCPTSKMRANLFTKALSRLKLVHTWRRTNVGQHFN